MSERRDLVFSVGASQDQSMPLIETHRTSSSDRSPLHLISAERVAYYQRLEEELAELRERHHISDDLQGLVGADSEQDGERDHQAEDRV